jgi:hypothetical protein
MSAVQLATANGGDWEEIDIITDNAIVSADLL